MHLSQPYPKKWWPRDMFKAHANLLCHHQLSPECIAVSGVPTVPPTLAPPAASTPPDITKT